MNQFLQFIAGNAWILIPIFIGLFNVAVRVKQKAAEQKARRDSLAEIQRRKKEALRTGRSLDEPVIVYDKPSTQQAAKTPAQARQERIEALRKQRMDQLRAMREKRAASASTGTATRQTPAQTPKLTPAQKSRTTPTMRPAPTKRPVQARTPQPNRQPNRPRVIPATQRQRPIQQPPTPGVQVPVTQVDPPSTEPVSAIAASSLRELRRDRPNKGSMKNRRSTGPISSTREMLHSRKGLRQAIVLNEVLNAPVALREPDSGPGNVHS